MDCDNFLQYAFIIHGEIYRIQVKNEVLRVSSWNRISLLHSLSEIVMFQLVFLRRGNSETKQKYTSATNRDKG